MSKYIDLTMTVAMQVPDNIEVSPHGGALIRNPGPEEMKLFPEIRFWESDERDNDVNHKPEELGIEVIDYYPVEFREVAEK